MSVQPANRNQAITIDPAIIVHINMLIVPSAAVFAFGTSRKFIERDLRAALSRAPLISHQRTRQPTTVASMGLLVSTLCHVPPLHLHRNGMTYVPT